MKMGITERSSCFLAASSWLVALLIWLSAFLEMSEVAAISCGRRETYVVTNTTTGDTGQCRVCPTEIQRKCNLQDRPVSTIECNWWDHPVGAPRVSVCEGCCGRHLATPTPTINRECQSGDIDESFPTPATYPWDCGRCQDGCKRKCEFWGTTVAREMCFFSRYDGEELYLCNCCCRRNTPPPSPPLPSPPPPPPPPSPSSPPPPSGPRNICAPEDGFTQIRMATTDCTPCATYCRNTCLGTGSSLVTTRCSRVDPSTILCTCCCRSTTSQSSSHYYRQRNS